MKNILLLLILNCNSAISQIIVSSNELTEMVKGLKTTSVSIETLKPYKGENELLGSGFIVGKGNKLYVVTNYHVIKKGFDSLQMIEKIITVGINIEYKKIYKMVNDVYIDSINDLAVLDVNGTKEVVVEHNHIDSTVNTQFSCIGISMFEPSDSIKEGQNIIIIGYPLGIGGDLFANNPVTRTGIIAQRVNKKTGTFLLDASVSHGNSGSPVFNASNAKLMGIISSYRSDISKIYDEKGKAIAYVETNSDLSVAISADLILKLIP